MLNFSYFDLTGANMKPYGAKVLVFEISNVLDRRKISLCALQLKFTLQNGNIMIQTPKIHKQAD